MKAAFLIIRATNRRHIRLGEDNQTEELGLELVMELGGSDTFDEVQHMASDLRDKLGRDNDLSLDVWEGIRRQMAAPSFRTAGELRTPEAHPVDLKKADPTPPAPLPPPANPGGYHRGKKATPGQINKMAELCSESQYANLAYPKEMVRLNKQKAENLTMEEASHLIDLLIAESRREKGY